MNKPIAVVSGGTRGIGAELSQRLVDLGYRVFALYHRDDRAAEEAARRGEGNLEPVRADLRSVSEVRRVAEHLVATAGAPEVLVNNAGVNRDRPFLELSEQDWDDVLATNLSGPFHLIQSLVPAMLAADGGCVVNIGSTTAIRPRRNGANYCASKAGLLHLTRCLAVELAPRIRVNALIPGFTNTPEVTERYRLDDPDVRAAVLDSIPLGRIGEAQQIADGLEFLVSAKSAYVTGQELIVDGGNYMG